ncbi:alpha/beta fold hydrolase [Thaumasiovibrio sp. DFM-14]|uniref:alpha/beta fold hydrolase n=1 Tax=Thaumasiovibrio sp. DFM-14 TaxID=3384792 RepID=UPI0039A0ED69
MSSKIYFEQPGKKSLRRLMVGAVTKLHHAVAPRHATKIAKKVFLTPVRMTRDVEQPKGLQQATLATSEGQVTTYSLGQGPTVLFSHGWSGAASQFFPLMEFVVANGYQAVAFDHIGHGNSHGVRASLPAFIAVTEALLDHFPRCVGIVSHSMGTVSTIESRHQLAETLPLLLVAPALNYTEGMMQTVHRSGYSMRAFKAVIDDLGKQYHLPFESVDPLKRLEKGGRPVSIIHDTNDRYASYPHSELASQLAHVELVATQGRGHGRILQSEEIFALTTRWLTQLPVNRAPAVDETVCA